MKKHEKNMNEYLYGFGLSFGVFIGNTTLYAYRGEFLKGVAIGSMASVLVFLCYFLAFCITYKA
jgi:hypothetical protein